MRGHWRRVVACTLGAIATVGAFAGNAGAVAITEHSGGLQSGQWPAMLAPGSDGNVWFTIWGCGTPSVACAVGRITPSGTISEFTSGLPTTTFPTAIANGPDGNAWFLDAPEGSPSSAIRRITPAGTITESPGAIESGDFPRDIAGGPDGNLWFTAGGLSPEITRLTTSGAVTHFSSPLLPNAGDLRSITRGPNGDLWFTDSGATPLIGRITTSGAIATFLLASTAFPADIVAGPDGNLWVTDGGSTPSIVRMTPGGTRTAFSAGLSSGAAPDAITAGPDGNLWFTELGTHPGIGRITPSGAITEFTAGLAPDTAARGITAGPDGNLWFSDQACNGAPGVCAVGRVALQLRPAVTTGDASRITATGAAISGTVNPLGGTVSRVAVRYHVGRRSPRTIVASPGSLPAGGNPIPIAARLSGLAPGQTITYAAQATNAFGTTTGSTRTFRTGRGPAPTISGFAQAGRRWRPGSHLASLSRRRPRSPVGTTLRFRLSEAAGVRIVFSRVRTGRRVGPRCVAPTANRLHRPRCTRLIGAGTLRFTAHSGTNRVHFEGHLTARRSLALGTYRVRVVATAFGRSSLSRSLTFVIVAR